VAIEIISPFTEALKVESWGESCKMDDGTNSVDVQQHDDLITISTNSPTDPKLLNLLSNLANNYSVFCQTDLSEQISKLEDFVEESVAKLEEFESLYEMKESENKEWCQTILPEVLQQGAALNELLNKRLDSLQSLITAIRSTLDQLESQVSQAEQSLGISNSSFRSVFKYFMRADTSPAPATSLQHPPAVLHLGQYFDNEN